MVSPLTRGNKLGKSFYKTISGNKRPVHAGRLYYNRGNGVMSEYSLSRDSKIKAKTSPTHAGYKKGNPKYAHAGDGNKKKRV